MVLGGPGRLHSSTPSGPGLIESWQSIPRPPSPVPERTPEKKEAAGISLGGGDSLFASAYCSSRERRRTGRSLTGTHIVLRI